MPKFAINLSALEQIGDYQTKIVLRAMAAGFQAVSEKALSVDDANRFAEAMRNALQGQTLQDIQATILSSKIVQDLQSGINLDTAALAEAVNILWNRVGSTDALIADGQHLEVNDVSAVTTFFEAARSALLDEEGELISSAALKVEAETSASKVDGLQAQWTVKLDLNGHIAGIGLAAEESTVGESSSAFIIRADRLAMVGEAGGATPVPFSVDSSGNVVFAGDLAAAGGSFSGTLNGVNGSFVGELSGATGSFGGTLLAGVLDFAQLSGVTTNYNSPGSFTITVPSDKTSMRVTLIGGGGAGGGNTNMYDSGGGGGGAGGVTTATFIGLTPGATYSLVVGSGGVPTNSGTNQPSGAGGHTYISGLTSANNGGQGGRNSLRGGAAAGGAGGSGTAASGGAGEASPQNGGWDTGEPPYNPGGHGGNGPFGPGGAGGGFGQAGSNGGGYGGGGGGAGQQITPDVYLPGGYGAGGRAIIEFFNPNSVVIRSEWNTLISTLNAQGIATS